MARKIQWIWYKCYHFSFLLEFALLVQYGFSHILSETSWLIQSAYRVRDYCVKRYLLKHDYTVSSYDSVGNDTSTEPVVWVYWAQGWDNPPKNVAMNFKSLQKYLRGCKIVPVDNGNYQEYVTIPRYIVEKMERKEMTLTFFSDVLRFSLLAENGGLWLDASIMVTSPVNYREIMSREFFTIRLKNDPANRRIITRGRWTIFLIGVSKKKDKLICLIRNSLYKYWREEKNAIHYFLTDYLMELIFQREVDLREKLEEIPFDHQGVLDFFPVANMPMNSEEVLSRNLENTTFFYLPWRNVYETRTEDGQLTLYGSVCEKLRNED